jgi:hypothetical protein
MTFEKAIQEVNKLIPEGVYHSIRQEYLLHADGKHETLYSIYDSRPEVGWTDEFDNLEDAVKELKEKIEKVGLLI